MQKFTIHKGLVAPMDRENVDTDAIIPKQFLKSIKKTGFGPNLFDEWRYLDKGEPGQDPAARKPNPDFVLNQPRYKGAKVLLARKNFGCGSSREHAPQALMRWGIRAVVGESFAEIFYGNCLALGIPCLVADHDTMLAIQAAAEADPAASVEVDVAEARLSRGAQSWQLDLAAGPRQMLATGQWDATGQLLANDAALQATVARLPYLAGFAAA